MSQDQSTERRETRQPADLRQTRSVTFVVNDVTNAAGFGLHISSTKRTDGFGGRWAECHFWAGSVNKPREDLLFLCYDGFLDASKAQNEFRINLGPKANILQIELTLMPDRVDLEATLLSKNETNNKRYTYPLCSKIPIREETGFWRSGKLFYSSWGVLNNRSGRGGAGYAILPPTVRPILLEEYRPLLRDTPMKEPKDNSSPIEL